MSNRQDIHDLAKGKWRAIHIALGVPVDYLSGKNGPCPMCGGDDRFRWTNLHMRGGYFCNGCGPGSGADLLMKVNNWDFATTKAKVLEQLGEAPMELPKADYGTGRLHQMRAAIWDAAKPLTGIDPASKYLARRGIRLREFPKLLRFHPRLAFTHDDKSRTYHPAMVAKFVSPDAGEYTLHYTFLTDTGAKADLPECRKTAFGQIPRGGAVRLCNSAETMGIAEGIETALSAMQLYDVPVWSALSAGGMVNFEPPPTCKALIVFSDMDAKYGGQAAAYSLAHKLACNTKREIQVEVRLPPEVGSDWNDVLKMEAA